MTKKFLLCVDNQFGFKSSHGTDMRLFLLKQTIAQYNHYGSAQSLLLFLTLQKPLTKWITVLWKKLQYNHNSSPVIVAFLDASKAFDKVNHSVLFNIKEIAWI